MSRVNTFKWLLVLGTVVPYVRMLPWFREYGLNINELRRQVFATPSGSFFGWDVVISSSTVVVLALSDDELERWQRAVCVFGSLLGTSVGLPLYLWLRERNRAKLACGDDQSATRTAG